MKKEVRKELASKAPNMVEAYKTYGEEGLRQRLTGIAERRGVEFLQLLAMGSCLDNTRKAYSWKDADKLVEFIVRRAGQRLHRGDCYLTYQR